MDKATDPLEQLLVDIKTGVEHLQSRPAPNQATDYRGQMRDMTKEVSSLSVRVIQLGEIVAKIPSPLTYRDLERAIAANAETFQSSASSIRDSLHRDRSKKHIKIATIVVLLLLVGVLLGLFVSGPLTPAVNRLGLTGMSLSPQKVCADNGGSIRSDNQGNRYCVYWIEKGSN